MNQQDRLRGSIERFRQWADKTYPGNRYGEWECEYSEWGDLYDSVRAVLDLPVKDWSDDTKKLLIYAIARDNEAEVISEELTDEQLLVLASAAPNTDETDARWQFAVQLARCEHPEERERLLIALATDPNEYVRRRAVEALAITGSKRAEQFAVTLWESGEEYQQMACLYGLWSIKSPLLPKYLDLAEQDGRQVLNAAAVRIRNKTGE